MFQHEKVRLAETPQEMRAEINRLRNYSNLIAGVLCEAEYKGLSAEDKYTMLTYFLLQHNDLLQKQLYDIAMNTPKPIFVEINGEQIIG